MTKNKFITRKLAGKETSLLQGERTKSKSTPVEVSQKEIIKKQVEHFVLCLRDAFGFRDPMEVIERVTHNLHTLFPLISIEKIFKWFYGNALGWSTNNYEDIVSQPSVDLLGFDSKDVYSACKIFGGRLMVFLQKFFRRQVRYTQSPLWKRKRSAFSKAQTFLMFKKGSPNVQAKLVQEAHIKHKEAMKSTKGSSHRSEKKKLSILVPEHSDLVTIKTNQPFWDDWELNYSWNYDQTGGWGDYDVDVYQWSERQKTVEAQASKIIHRLFKPGCFKRVIQREQTMFPSTSAHEEKNAKRHHGGAVNVVKELFNNFAEGGLSSMTYHPRVGVKEHREIVFSEIDVASHLLSNEFIAEPVYLQEPLKVRTITKGPSIPYWFFKPIQQWLWNSLLKHPVFQLIGTPITGEILDKMLPFAKGEGKWLSGDYSAATDNLSRWLSKYIWSEICIRSGVPDEVYQLGKKGLIGHKLRYKDEPELISQSNGQLMGSPLSFPILCIANATICMLAFDKKKRNFDGVPLRINGDDCVMYYTENERQQWKSLAEFIGMSPSPGKCYYAKEWLQMNSELFILRRGSFKQIPFINFSLASPFLAKGGSERTVESISQTMIDFCHKKSPKFIDIFLRRMGPFLKEKIPGLISWFLPQSLGGLGLMSKELSGNLFSTRQLKVATLFYQRGVDGRRLPYQISSIKGGTASYQFLKQLKKYEYITPIFDKDRVQVKSYWSERFFKEREEQKLMVPLLWENLVKQGSIHYEKRIEKSVYSKKIFQAFNVKSKDIKPLELKELLRFRGLNVIIPKEAYKSNYEPMGVFRDALVSLTGKSRALLLT